MEQQHGTYSGTRNINDTLTLLDRAHDAGFSVEVILDKVNKDHKLRIKGVHYRQDIVDDLTEAKESVIWAFRAQQMVQQLRADIDWLDNRGNWKKEEFKDRLMDWANKDELLRKVYGYKGCPVLGCKYESAVSCLHCANMLKGYD